MGEAIYEMKAAIVVGDERRDEIVISFEPMDSDPKINVALPSASVGHFVVQLAAAHQSLAMKPQQSQAVMLPLKLTGSRPFAAPDGSPVLLLQFENVFELAVLVTEREVQMLAAVAEQGLEAPPSDAPKPN